MKTSQFPLGLILACSLSALMVSLAGAEPYQLKNRSIVTANLEGRAPFWPIGWAPPKEGDPIENDKGRLPVNQPPVELKLKVTSILLGSPSLITIGGRSFAEGERIPVVSQGRRFMVLIRQVRDGGVVLEYEDAGRQQRVLAPVKRTPTVFHALDLKTNADKFEVQADGP